METYRPLNYFSSADFVRCDLKEGVLRTPGGTRLIGVNEDFLRGFVQACEHETGPATVLILRRCGRRFGSRLAQRYESELSKHLGRALRDCTMAEFDALVRDLWRGSGMGELTVGWEHGRSGFLPIKLDGSPMQNIGPSGHIADDLFCGIIEGFFGHFAVSPLMCIQSGDARIGSKEGTTFILASAEQQPRVEQLVTDRIAHSVIISSLSRGSL